MRIGLDMMGGDFAPLEALRGCELARKSMEGITLVMFGDKGVLAEIAEEEGIDLSNFELIHCPEVIGMGEHPTKALAQKKESSIAVGFHLLKEQKIDAFIGAGNTGAMMVGSMFSVKQVEGVFRPAITSVLPKISGNIGILLDVGANADCRPDVLYQFAVLGSQFCKYVYKIDNPRVGLLNIGEEREKGNLVTQAAHNLMAETNDFNFIGNVEGRDLFLDNVDVVVSDGFTGNIVLKACESMYYLLMKRGVKDEFLDRFNYESYGGTPILGVNAPVIIGHGISKAVSFESMIRLAKETVESGLIDKIKSSF
ncbi:MAG: phosphate acyltransferase PlsX [Bacteroidetes bacterium]|nr:phosphate acyltransferase PlsX [Bacteroidota bacterium]